MSVRNLGDWSPLDRDSDPVVADPDLIKAAQKRYEHIATTIDDTCAKLQKIIDTGSGSLAGKYVGALQDKAKSLNESLTKAGVRYHDVANEIAKYEPDIDSALKETAGSLDDARHAVDLQTKAKAMPDGKKDKDGKLSDAEQHNQDAKNKATTEADDSMSAAKTRFNNAMNALNTAGHRFGDAINCKKYHDGLCDSMKDKIDAVFAKIAKIFGIIGMILAVLAILIPGVNAIAIAGLAAGVVSLVSSVVLYKDGKGSLLDVILGAVGLGLGGLGALSSIVSKGMSNFAKNFAGAGRDIHLDDIPPPPPRNTPPPEHAPPAPPPPTRPPPPPPRNPPPHNEGPPAPPPPERPPPPPPIRRKPVPPPRNEAPPPPPPGRPPPAPIRRKPVPPPRNEGPPAPPPPGRPPPPPIRRKPVPPPRNEGPPAPPPPGRPPPAPIRRKPVPPPRNEGPPPQPPGRPVPPPRNEAPPDPPPPGRPPPETGNPALDWKNMSDWFNNPWINKLIQKAGYPTPDYNMWQSFKLQWKDVVKFYKGAGTDPGTFGKGFLGNITGVQGARDLQAIFTAAGLGKISPLWYVWGGFNGANGIFGLIYGGGRQMHWIGPVNPPGYGENN